ncbi:hypothetical protein ACJJTC_013873 [Scirpophaga incertulas]
MLLKQVFVFIFLGFVTSCLCAVPKATKCRREDSDCLKRSAQSLLLLLAEGKVSPQLKPLDPLRISKIEPVLSNLKFLARDFIVRGLGDCIFDNITINAAKTILNVDAHCTLVGESEYEIKGKVQNLELGAQGHLAVLFKQLLLKIVLYIEDKKEEDKIYWHLHNWNFSYVVKEKSKINMSNLFKGSAKPTQAIQERLGETLTTLISELEPLIVDAIVNEILENIKTYFHLLPFQELMIH